MSMEALQAREDLMKSIENFLKKFNRISFQKMPKVLMQAWDKFLEIKHAQSEDVQEFPNKLVEDVRSINEELAEFTNTPSWNLPNTSYDDDDDEEISILLKDIIIFGLPPCVAITPILFTEEPVDSLIIEDEHFDTIPATESDEFIKSSVDNLVPTPSESEDELTTSHFLMRKFRRIYSNPLFDEEIISDKVDASIISSLKIDSLLEQFSGELAHIDLIPPGINEADFDPEEDIRFVERLLYNNSSPRPPKAFQANSNMIIESLPILVDALREEIDILHCPGDSIPPGIESDDFDSECDDNSTSLPEFESFHVDYLDSVNSTIDVVEDIPVDVPNILPTHPALQLDFDFIPSNDLGSDLDVSSPSGDRNKIYDPVICI
ncbi:hypothetical protein Tco_0420616 [Tanacetum coccineum]